MKITNKNGCKKQTILSRNIPVGFFTGNIGMAEGLFFRSCCDITLLSENSGFGKCWGYPREVDGCTVNNYQPVEVNIEIQ